MKGREEKLIFPIAQINQTINMNTTSWPARKTQESWLLRLSPANWKNPVISQKL